MKCVQVCRAPQSTRRAIFNWHDNTWGRHVDGEWGSAVRHRVTLHLPSAPQHRPCIQLLLSSTQSQWTGLRSCTVMLPKSSTTNERDPLLPFESNDSNDQMLHHQDTESGSSTNRLNDAFSSSRDDDDFGPKKEDSRFRHFLQFLGGGIFFPDPSTAEPIEILLNTRDQDKREKLIKTWRDNKLSELNFVGVVSALLAGVLTSTGSWPAILPNGELSPWPVRTSWYCGIVLALFSILSAADQTVRLHRLSAHRDGLSKIHDLLSKRQSGKSRTQPSTLQIMTWQMPVMFLTGSTICMIVGMFLHVWSATVHLWRPGTWDDNAKVCASVWR
jgi:hypothetical protein